MSQLLMPDEEVPKIILPMLWLDEGADIDEENSQLVKDLVVKPIKITVVFQWLFVAIGAVLMVVSAVVLIVRHNKKRYYA